MRLDFKRIVSNSQQISKHISKRRLPVVINTHPENQTTFSKVPIFPGDKSYSDALTKKAQQKNILIFTDSIPSRTKMYNLNKALKNGNLYQDNLHLLQLGKKILFDNFISHLNSNFLTYPHP